MDKSLLKSIVHFASEKLKKQGEKIERKQNKHIYKISELREEIKHVHYMIAELNKDLETCTHKHKSYIQTKIWYLEAVKDKHYQEIRNNKSMIRLIQAEADEYLDVLSDEYYDMNTSYYSD